MKRADLVPSMPWIGLVVAALAVGIHVLPPATAALQYDRHALALGEAWRLVTGHLTHFGFNHLAWDVAALLVLATLCERRSRAQTAAVIAAATLAVALALLWFQPQFAIYRGLSGIDCALFGLAAGNLLGMRSSVARSCAAIALVAFAGKCGLELATAAPVFARSNGYDPVPLAHLVGCGVGLLAAKMQPVRRGARYLPPPKIRPMPLRSSASAARRSFSSRASGAAIEPPTRSENAHAA